MSGNLQGERLEVETMNISVFPWVFFNVDSTEANLFSPCVFLKYFHTSQSI